MLKFALCSTQVQRRTAAGSETSAATEGFRFSYKGVTDGLLIAREEGIRALFKGAATQVLRSLAPNDDKCGGIWMGQEIAWGVEYIVN